MSKICSLFSFVFFFALVQLFFCITTIYSHIKKICCFLYYDNIKKSRTPPTRRTASVSRRPCSSRQQPPPSYDTDDPKDCHAQVGEQGAAGRASRRLPTSARWTAGSSHASAPPLHGLPLLAGELCLRAKDRCAWMAVHRSSAPTAPRRPHRGHLRILRPSGSLGERTTAAAGGRRGRAGLRGCAMVAARGR